MCKRIRTLFENERGNALLLVGLALVGMLAAAGLILDGGKLYFMKSHLQKTANAAVLSGAQELTHSEAAVSEVVNEVLAAHGEEGSLSSLQIAMEDKVSVDLQKPVPVAFIRFFGTDTVTVRVHAAAELGTMGRAMGAAPLGIDESVPLEYYREYELKVDQTKVDTGNFGVLALGGPGAQTYEDNMRYGYQDEIKLGDILDTQTGNIAGKTRRAIQERLDSCPYPAGETHHRDCSRILLVPVYRPHDVDQNQMKSVEVTGFAYFYITEPMNAKDTSITGMFIKRAGTGFVDENSANKGAFSIRLTE